jgi:hypothetical protein
LVALDIVDLCEDSDAFGGYVHDSEMEKLGWDEDYVAEAKLRAAMEAEEKAAVRHG